MVDYSGGDEASYKRRQVYEHSKVIELKESRISALGAHDNVTILGNTKGYVYPYEQISDPKSSVPMFEPMNSGAKRGNERVDIIKYLPRAHVIASLIGNKLQIFLCQELKQVQEIKMKVSNFCLNAAVYRSGQGAPQTDQLCLVVDEKYIYFFEHKLHSKEIKFEKDPTIERGYNIAIKPSQLHWDDDKIYLSNKRAYVVMRKSDGQIITKVDIDKQEVPPFAVSKSKCLVLNDRNTGQYLTDNGISDQIKFEFDPSKKIVSLFLVDMYVIVVYETSVCIYNASNGDFLEERGKLDKFKYKAAAVNIEGTEVYLAANNIKEARNTIQSEVYLMKEIPAQKQIEFLLGQCRIQEAREVFQTKEVKNLKGDQFKEKKKKFSLNAGWVLLTNSVDYEQVLSNFKMTDMDPREIILLFNEKYIDAGSLPTHIKQNPKSFISSIISQLRIQKGLQINQEEKVDEAKRAMLSLLESWNYKSVPELQKDPDREAKFLYSKFSPYSDCIRTDTKFRLSEIVQIVQTTILKMYVDMNQTRKIYEFFGNVDQVTNQYQTSLFINAEKLQQFLELKHDNQINLITTALLCEYKKQNEDALNIWTKIQTKDACERTVAILKKLESKDYIKRYAKWIFGVEPEIGLKLFTDESKSTGQSLNPDEVLAFLDEAMIEAQSFDRKRSSLDSYPCKRIYLEYVTQNNNASERYFTKLAEILIDNCFQVLPASQKIEGASAAKLTKARERLYNFLRDKSQYNAAYLMDKIKNSWMFEELILLLLKEKKYDEAIKKYVDKEKFQDAEDFCIQHKNLGLLTTLLTIYFDSYKMHTKDSEMYKQQEMNQKSVQARVKADQYREQALELMKKHSSTNDLDPLTVLRLIPEDWELKTSQYNLVSFLSSIFDNMMTQEENSKIAMHLSKMEQLNSEKEKNELQTAYMVITEDMLCKVCKSKLKHKNIRIFPHGQAFHMRCAKDPCECPVTRQRFDIDPTQKSSISSNQS